MGHPPCQSVSVAETGGPALASRDYRFHVPIYSVTEASSYLGVPRTTLDRWAQGDATDPIITWLRPSRAREPSLPFVGLAEGLVLSAFRKLTPLRRLRPALTILKQEMGIEHALASRRLFFDGANLLWDMSNSAAVDEDVRDAVRELIRVDNRQGVFHEVVRDYLQLITYDEAYAEQVRLPQYKKAVVVADPLHSYGHPYFVHGGIRLQDVLSRARAGEPAKDIADDYGVPIGEVREAVRVAGRRAA
jgi:uncharacterized protein (DUF433 family)